MKSFAALTLLLFLCTLSGQDAPKSPAPSTAPAPASTPPPAVAPTKEALRQQIADMKVQAYAMQTRIELLEKQLHDIEEAERNKPIPVAAGKSAAPLRCAGHTKDGARCSRNAEAGSRFCWQHKARR